MKRWLHIVAFLVLGAQLPLLGYDTSPSNLQIVPEAIYAAATGGGTWATDVQITNFGSVPANVGDAGLELPHRPPGVVPGVSRPGRHDAVPG